MTRLRDVARHVRSKNAGPFWVTFDVFFADDDTFEQYHAAPALSDDVIGRLYGVDATSVRRYSAPTLNVLKISIPRATPQGGEYERDLHSGQMFVRLLDVDLDTV